VQPHKCKSSNRSGDALAPTWGRARHVQAVQRERDSLPLARESSGGGQGGQTRIVPDPGGLFDAKMGLNTSLNVVPSVKAIGRSDLNPSGLSEPRQAGIEDSGGSADAPNRDGRSVRRARHKSCHRLTGSRSWLARVQGANRRNRAIPRPSNMRPAAVARDIGMRGKRAPATSHTRVHRNRARGISNMGVGAQTGACT